MFENSIWITYPERRSSVTFKKTFRFSKNIKSAKISITSMGWYHCFANNKRLDRDVFSPGWTQYDKRVQYQTYRILKFENNELNLSVDVGEGWGGGDHFAWTRPGNFLYFQMSLIYEIELIFEDDSSEIIGSDESVDVYSNHIESSDIYGGETQNIFKKIEYLGKAKRIEINTNIIPQEGERIVTGERIKPKKMFVDPAGNTVIDFGQNFVGYVEVNIKGKKGDVISYTPGEILDKNGIFYNENYRKAKSFFSFVLTGEPDKFIPNFSFMGGRYIKLIDCPKYVKKENFEAVLVHSNLKRTGGFKCGHKLMNRLYKNIIYGQLSNYLDVPTDCPQRDERLGWTADTQVFTSTGAINFDVKRFLNKYLADMRVCQFPNGGIERTIPFACKVDVNNDKIVSTGWADACCVIPWELYLAYGDKSILSKNIEMMEKYIGFLEDYYKKPYIIELPFSFGDWLGMDRIQGAIYQGLTRYDLLSTAHYILDLRILIDSYKQLGIDTLKVENKLNDALKAYQNEFIKDGHLIGNKAHFYDEGEMTCYTQTGLAVTLAWNLCTEKDKKSLAKDLADLIDECGGKMTTGFIGTPCLLKALSENGYKDKAYDLLFFEQFPSWLYSVRMGATTIWEHYDGINENGDVWSKEMNSFNHYAYGSVFYWIYNNSIGINILKPGYKEILIKPLIDKRLGFVDGFYDSKFGRISVKWKCENEKVSYNIRVPKGIKAYIELENGYKTILENGGKVVIE